jgi:hypothetical protein
LKLWGFILSTKYATAAASVEISPIPVSIKIRQSPCRQE